MSIFYNKYQKMLLGAAIGDSIYTNNFSKSPLIDYMFCIIDYMFKYKLLHDLQEYGDNHNTSYQSYISDFHIDTFIAEDLVNWSNTKYGTTFCDQDLYLKNIINDPEYEQNPLKISENQWISYKNGCTSEFSFDFIVIACIIGCVKNSDDIQELSQFLCKITHHDLKCIITIFTIANIIHSLLFSFEDINIHNILNNVIKNGKLYLEVLFDLSNSTNFYIKQNTVNSFYLSTGSKLVNLKTDNCDIFAVLGSILYILRTYWRYTNTSFDKDINHYNIFTKLINLITQLENSNNHILCVICGCMLGLICEIPRSYIDKLDYKDLINDYSKKLYI